MSLRNTIGRGSNNIVEVRAPGLKGDAGAAWKGNWATSTSYAKNDLVRYIPNGNLYISTSVHTSSSSNEPTKSGAQWDLFAQTGDAEGWANTARHTIFVDSTGFTLVDQTPTPSAAWEVSSSHVEVSQTSTSGSGTGVKFAITTDASGNPYLTVTNPGSTYVAAQTIVVTDPGSTSSTATVTIESLVGDSGYSAKHGALQATDWANYTTGFVPLDAKSEDASGLPDIDTSTGTITFAGVHGFSAGDTIMFQIQTNTSYPTTITAPTGLAMEPKVYYVKSDGLTTTALRVSEDSGTNGSIRVITAQGTGTLIAGNEKYSAKSWAVGGTGVTSFEGRGSSKDWATKIDGAADGGDNQDYSAKAWSIGGTGITDTAAHGAAMEWARETSGNVDGTDYSAKEYAQGVQASTGGSSKDYATYVGGGVRGATSDHSAKAWAVGGTGVTDTSSKGAAKEWATEVEDNTVAGAGTYSALHYSAKANKNRIAAAASAAAVAASFDSFDDKYLGVMADRVFTASSDSGLKITSTAHGLVANDVIRVTSSAGSPDLPVNLSVSTNYFVIAGGLATDVFYLATSEGGGAIAFSDAGIGTHTWYYGTSLTAGITGTWAQNSSVITVSNDSGIRIGQEVTGSGIPADANVVAINGNDITISENMAALGSSVAVVFTSWGVNGLYNLTKDGPGLNNDGDALATGLLYYNTTDGSMRVYDGSSWIAASASVNVTILEYQYSISGTPTTVSGSDLNSASLLFASQESVQVFLNGVLLLPKIGGTANDYHLDTSNTVTFASALAASDIVNVVVYKTFEVADAVSAATGGTFSGNVTVPAPTAGGHAANKTYADTKATTGKAIAMAMVFG